MGWQRRRSRTGHRQGRSRRLGLLLETLFVVMHSLRLALLALAPLGLALLRLRRCPLIGLVALTLNELRRAYATHMGGWRCHRLWRGLSDQPLAALRLFGGRSLLALAHALDLSGGPGTTLLGSQLMVPFDQWSKGSLAAFTQGLHAAADRETLFALRLLAGELLRQFRASRGNLHTCQWRLGERTRGSQ